MDGIETYRVGGKTLRIVTDRSVFTRFRRRWNGALKDYKSASIYVSHQWLDAMWEAYSDDIHGRIAMVDDADGPCAIAPLMGLRYRYRGLSIPAVGPLDFGRSSRSDVPLIRDPEDCIDILRGYTKRWGASLWHLDRFPADSQLCQLIAGDWDLGRRTEHYESPSLGIIDTSASWQQFLDAKSKSFRDGCRAIQDDLDGLDMDVIRDVNAEAEPLMSVFRALAANGESASGDGFALDARREHFLKRILADASAEGALYGVVARKKGQPVAVSFGIAFNETIYIIETVHDTKAVNRNVGIGCFAELLWLAFDAPGIQKCDMDTIRAPGDFRRRWATRIEKQVNALLMNGGMGSAAIRAGRTLGGLKKAFIPSRPAEIELDQDSAA